MFVLWDTLRDPETQRVRLTYGDVLSIDAIQGNTSTDHIDAMPSGSRAVNSFKSYVAKSRSRETTWLVVADGQERGEIMERRALGSTLPITEGDVWANVARNLSRQPEKELATDLLDRADNVQTGTIRSLATAFQPVEQRQADGKAKTAYPEAAASRRADADMERNAVAMQDVAERAAAAAGAVTGRLTGPGNNEARKAIQAARRSTRNPAARPKHQPQTQPRAPMSKADIKTEFSDALRNAGLRPPGEPIMDGQLHRVPVEGDRGRARSGAYRGHLDGMPAGYIENFKTGRKETWRASRVPSQASPEDRARDLARIAKQRAARDAERQQGERTVSHKAQAIWKQAKPASGVHPYLARKDVQAHGLRQDRRGNLLVPMRDRDGTLWSLQTIGKDGDKLFMKGGRKQGSHAVLGDVQPDVPFIIAEGFATAATMREATSLPVVVAFDAGNLERVAQAYHERSPTQRIIVAADNDHHRAAEGKPNVGREKGQATATAVDGVLLLPTFKPGEAGSDFNDYAAIHGKAAVRAFAQEALQAHGIPLQSVTQAQRDAARQQSRSEPHGVRQDQVRTTQEAARRAQERGSSDGPHL